MRLLAVEREARRAVGHHALPLRGADRSAQIEGGHVRRDTLGLRNLLFRSTNF